MTIRTLMGRAICSFRERVEWRPIHNFKRRKGSGIQEWTTASPGMEKIYMEVDPPHRVCTRCGLVVQVRTRKRKETE